jgi:hypothetical protein
MTIRILLISLVVLSFVSCKKNNEPEPNLPPSAFRVTAKVAGTDVVLTWTRAKDPNGDPVTYAVVYKDTLAKNLTDTTFTIKNVGYSTTAAGSVIARDNQKATTSAPFSSTTGANPYVAIPDVKFEKALIELKIDDAQDGKLLLSSALKVTQLEIYGLSIDNLQGIDAFVNLTGLFCSSNNLTSLDLSKNTALIKLNCASNKLTSLDLSKNTALVDLECRSNKLVSLDVSRNIELTDLSCYVNNLTSLDVSKNSKLTTLFCHTNNLTSLDVSKNSKLTWLFCHTNNLTSLDVSNNTSLAYLYCYTNRLTSLDVSRNPALFALFCNSNKITSLDVSKNISLAYLICYNNSLTSLDASKNTALIRLECDSNKIQTICLSDLAKVKSDWAKDASAVYKVCQ